MEISILCTSNKPLKAYFNKAKAEQEYYRLKELDGDYIDYCVITMSTEDQYSNKEPCGYCDTAKNSEYFDGFSFCPECGRSLT